MPSAYSGTKMCRLSFISRPAKDAQDQIKHGINRDADGKVVSYVFEPDVEIGDVPTGGRFCFPVRTVMQFDYGFLRGDDWSLQQQFDDLEVKCHLDREEYLNLVYAMYCSKRTPIEYKPYLEKVLEEAYGSK